MRKLIHAATALLFALLPFILPAQTSITTSGTTENFNTMGTGTALPANWKMSSQGQGNISSYATGTNITAVTQVANSGSPTTGGAYNWGTTAGTDRAIGFMTSGAYTSPNSVMAYYRNTTGATLTTLTVTFQVERYRINTATFSLSFSSSLNGSTWTAQTAGDIATTDFPTGASTYTFGTPQTISKTVTITGLSLANNDDFYLRWVFTNTGNTNSQGIGLDDVQVTAPLVVTATLRDILNNDVNSDGLANPGEGLTYATTIKNAGPGNATNVTLSTTAPTNTTFVPGSVKTSALARNDTFATAFNTTLNGSTVLVNDYGLKNGVTNLKVLSFGTTGSNGLTTAAGAAGVTNSGGTLTVNADGTFNYTPPAGFTGVDRFTYVATTEVAGLPNNDAVVTIAVGSPAAAAADSYPVTGNVNIQINAAQGVKNNDGGNATTIISVGNGTVGTNVTTAQGGTVNMNADGSFAYTPPAGFTGSDNFSYTIDNGYISPSTAVVTLTLTNLIYFVDNSSAAVLSDGRLSSPFKTLANFNSGSVAAGSVVFIKHTGTDYNGGVALDINERLFGSGHTGGANLADVLPFILAPNSAALPAINGSRPAVTNSAGNGVTLASGNTLRGFDLGNATGFAIADNGNTGNLTVSELNINNTTGGGFRTDNGGTLAVTLGSLTAVGGTNGISLSGTSGTFAVTGATTITNSTGVGLALASTTSGASATFNTITVGNSGSHGIELSDNTGTLAVAGTTIINSPAAGTNISLHIQGGSGNINFATLNVNGRRDRGIRIASGNRNITIGTLSIDNPNVTSTVGILVVGTSGGIISFGPTTLNNGGANGSAVEIQSSSAMVNFASGSAISNSSGNAFFITGGAGNITYNGTISNTDGACIGVNNRTGGTIDFTGNISHNAATSAIAAANNTGGTIRFSGVSKSFTSGTQPSVNLATNTGATFDFTNGGLAISTTTGAGFNASGGGTINVTGGSNTITTTTGTALNLSSVIVGSNGVTLSNITTNNANSSAAASGVSLSGVTGTGGGSITISGGSIKGGNINPAFNISAGSISITYAGTIEQSNGNRIVNIANTTGGTTTLSGNITTSGNTNTGINLSSNTGATINFTGLLALNGALSGFTAIGGGTVTATNTANTIGNITPPTTTSLNVTNTTIGASGLTFRSISSNGATKGITLNTTGAGGLIVTGTGTANGSGGTIQNIAQRGIEIISSSNISLKNMALTNANQNDGIAPCGAADNSGCNAAIYLNTVTGAAFDNIDISGTTTQQGLNIKEVSNFTLINSTIANAGTGGVNGEEGGIYALNLSGTSAITNTAVTLPGGRGACIYNISKTLALTVTGSSFNGTQSSAVGADGFEVSSFGTSNTTLDFVNSTFNNAKTNGIQVIGEDNSITSADVTGCTMDYGGFVGGGGALDFASADNASFNFNIINNPTLRGALTSIVNIYAAGSAAMQGRVNGNAVSCASGSGTAIRAICQESSNMKIEINGNTVTGVLVDNGIDVISRAGNGRMDAIISNNNVTVGSAGSTANANIRVAAGASGSTFTNKTCAWVKNNAISVPNAFSNWELRVVGSHQVLLQGAGASMAAVWNANANTPVSPPAIMNPLVSGAGTILYGQTCVAPSNPLP